MRIITKVFIIVVSISLMSTNYATKTLNKSNTDLLISQRAMTVNTTIGDWFAAAYPVMTAPTYNNYVDIYLNNEVLCDHKKLYGTNHDGGVYPIQSQPTRPRPIHK